MQRDNERTRARYDNLRASCTAGLRTLFDRPPARLVNRRLKFGLGSLLLIAYALVQAS